MDLQLVNLPLRGKNYIWSNSRFMPTMARLDRFLIFLSWSLKFPNSKQEAIANTSSDHSPLLFTVDTGFKKTIFFRFENAWLHSSQFKCFVKEKWLEMGNVQRPVELHDKFNKIQKEIKDWTNQKIGLIKSQIIVCRDFIDWLGKVEENRSITSLEKWMHVKLKRRYVELSLMEEEIWRQRAKIRWENKGDRNTRYFHSLASAKKRGNNIPALEHEGKTVRSQKGKADIFWKIYQELMGTQSEQLPLLNWSNLYGNNTVTQELTQPVSEEEIIKVINDWPSNKSPGPDGFTGEFYKEFQDVLLPDLHRVITRVLEDGLTLEQLNTSYIVLIPKKEDAKLPQDFRPISLVHGIQKIVSKILANRLQPIIPNIVNDSQTRFVKGRQITEGFLYAQHVVQCAKDSKIPIALFKADIHKAFDTVS